MHPILERRSRWLLYIAAWLIVALLLAGVLNLATPRPFGRVLWFAGPLALLYANVCLSAWWVCRAVPLDRRDLVAVLGTLLGTAVVSSGLWVGLASLWSAASGAFLALAEERSVRLGDLMILFIAGIPLYLLSAVVHYLLIAFERARAAERRALEAAVTAREAELRALRAQLHPHFLFNSLNSINALVGSDPEGARRMCQSLGDFLRGTLSLAHRETVPLADELALIDRYLAVERVRFGERLAVERVVAADAERCLVPPLLLQPLVENAIKHGVSARVEGGTVRIEADRRGAWLRVAVENPVDESPSERPGERMGLENVRRRIAALDAREAGLDVERSAGRFRVTLTLPAVPSAAPALGGETHVG